MNSTTTKTSTGPGVSFQDAKILSLLDNALADAVKLWTNRPSPGQRMPRIAFGKSFVEFREAMGDEDFSALFPETKRVVDSVMSHIRW